MVSPTAHTPLFSPKQNNAIGNIVVNKSLSFCANNLKSPTAIKYNVMDLKARPAVTPNQPSSENKFSIGKEEVYDHKINLENIIIGKDKRTTLRAIRVLIFSPDGTKLLSGGQDDDNSIAVHDWSQLIIKSPVDKARVLDAVWINNDEFVFVGPKHIKFFELKGRPINGKKGVFGKMEVEPLISVCSAFENKSIVTGTSKGNVIVEKAQH